MAIAVVDASVLIAFLSPDDLHHEAALRTLTASLRSELVVPATAYSEVLVHPYREGRAEASRIERFFKEMAIRVEPIGLEIARRAARLRARHSRIRLPDALVIATADELGAGRILTADASWKQVSRRVIVI